MRVTAPCRAGRPVQGRCCRRCGRGRSTRPNDELQADEGNEEDQDEEVEGDEKKGATAARRH